MKSNESSSRDCSSGRKRIATPAARPRVADVTVVIPAVRGAMAVTAVGE
jgi:hypothetical protein